jgi:hypothetical protein
LTALIGVDPLVKDIVNLPDDTAAEEIPTPVGPVGPVGPVAP